MWEKFKRIMTEDYVIEITNLKVNIKKPFINISIGIVVGLLIGRVLVEVFQ